MRTLLTTLGESQARPATAATMIDIAWWNLRDQKIDRVRAEPVVLRVVATEIAEGHQDTP